MILIEELSKLPGIGKKTARRLAFHILKMPASYSETLSKAVADVKKKIRFCRVCGYITEQDLCVFCRDPKRDKSTICVVEDLQSVISVEKTGVFRGVYHVLNGLISIIDGIGPDQVNIDKLVERVKEGGIKELLIAIPHSSAGDMTVMYIQKRLKPFRTRITRIAAGIPVGGEVEYTDMTTLAESIQKRQSL